MIADDRSGAPKTVIMYFIQYVTQCNNLNCHRCAEACAKLIRTDWFSSRAGLAASRAELIFSNLHNFAARVPISFSGAQLVEWRLLLFHARGRSNATSTARHVFQWVFYVPRCGRTHARTVPATSTFVYISRTTATRAHAQENNL